MTTTTERPGFSDVPPPRRDPRTRARAYLDLWERHLTQVALEGPPIAPSPVPSAPMPTAATAKVRG